MANLSLHRVLVIAPHPDDDVIACAGLLQRAGEPRILFVTDGERNPWPQRFLFGKLRLTDEDRAQWGAMRRREALESLQITGAGEHQTRFLGFPDQRLMSLARRGDRRLLALLTEEIRTFAPTLIVSPSTFDAHYDHRAIAWYAHQAARECGAEIVTYSIHGGAPRNRVRAVLELAEDERQRKRAAILSHKSQLLLSRERFLSYATADETFYRAEFDVVRVDSRWKCFALRMKHALFVLFGRHHELRVETAADVEDRAGDVARLL